MRPHRLALVPLVALATAAGAQQPTTVSYVRAEQLLPWHTASRVLGDVSDAAWYPDSTRFWYRTRTASGMQFVLVDAARNTRGLVFDNARLARAMTLAADTAFDPQRLPFQTFRFADEGKNTRVIEFGAIRKRWACDIAAYSCTIKDTTASEMPYVQSPDRKWEAFVHKHNLWIRPRAACQVEVRKGSRPAQGERPDAPPRRDTTAGADSAKPQPAPVPTAAAQAVQAAGVPCDSTQLTTDGVEDWSYGLTSARPQQLFRPQPRRPGLRWSPDGRKIAISRIDERRVARMPYISYTSQRPRLFTQPYALPGDSVVPVPAVYVVDVASKQAVKADLAPVPNQLQLAGSARDSAWSEGSDKLYLSWLTRASKAAYLAEVDAATGKTRIIARDSSKTYVEMQQNTDPASWYVTRDGRETIWWSERDGWGHLYRIGADGKVINQVTNGPWQVGAVQHVDEASRTIWFTARGRETGNPYYARLYRVGFDGSGLTLLTPEDGNHRITFSPSGRWFVDSYSSIDKPQVTVLRSAGGGIVRQLEKADVKGLEGLGWRPAQTFTVKPRDGVTDVHGVIYLPPNVDPTRKYPVIDNIYPGPQVGSVGQWAFKAGGEPAALAELGFVVIQLDHLGTPYRSKAFHDAYYGNFTDNGLPDHIAAIKQLAIRHPYMDLDRVGIYGHSGGGFASTDAIFRYPDFFKVAVSGAGNHDNRSYNIYWAEKYQGLLRRDTLRRTDNFAGSANAAMAGNLRGKLLLMHGDMDDNVHPAMTIQVVDALIRANRSFDLIMAPNRAHSLNEPYFIRRRWDYFVTHLMGATPPENYEISRPGGSGTGAGDDTPDVEDDDPFLENAGGAVTVGPRGR